MVEKDITARIENMVAAITIGQKLNLKKLASSESSAIYNPKKFPGIVYRIQNPKLGTLIFNTGKVICSGAKSRKDIDKGLGKLIAKLKEKNVKLKGKPKVEIQNIVGSANLGFRVNLDLLATECENTEYEPEQFPGLVFRVDKPKTVMLIFRSGKIIITGAKTPQDANLAANVTREIVKEYAISE